jgi:two-component system, NarL family, sensor kinase
VTGTASPSSRTISKPALSDALAPTRRLPQQSDRVTVAVMGPTTRSDATEEAAAGAGAAAVPRPRGRNLGPPVVPRRWSFFRAARRWLGLGRAGAYSELKTGTALLQFALAGLLALVVLATIGMAALRHVAEREAMAQAVQLTTDRGRLLVQPALTNALVAGDPAALKAFDRRVRDGLLGPRVARVKLWDQTGHILYSDDPQLIGQHFPLAADDLETLSTGKVHADFSQLSAPENKYERQDGQLLEVYARVHAPSGQPLLFEAYLRVASINRSAQAVADSVGPAFLLALLALQVLQLPLVWRLVRRIKRGQRERDALHRKVAEASDDERRRIARDLHDGVVQSLAGLSFSLAAATEELRHRTDDPVVARARAKVEAAAGSARRDVGELRTLIAEIYPPDLEGQGLGAAMGDLLAPLTAAGIGTTLTMPAGLSAASREETIAVYRAAQEALRNVTAHAQAQNVLVDVVEGRDRISLVVRDDGRGFDRDALPVPGDRPHFGLRLLEGLAREVGGSMVVETSPGQGTTFTLEIPLRGAQVRGWRG